MPGDRRAASKKSRYGLCGVGLGVDRDPVALHLDEQVVERRGGGSRCARPARARAPRPAPDRPRTRPSFRLRRVRDLRTLRNLARLAMRVNCLRAVRMPEVGRGGVIALQQVGLEFLECAATRFEFREAVNATPERVFAAIAADPSTWSWFPGLDEGRYESRPPHGVGSIRAVRMGEWTYRETILAWDAPRRWAYRVDETSAPLFSTLAEDWRVEPAPRGAVVQWTFAIELARDTPVNAGIVAEAAGRRSRTRCVPSTPTSHKIETCSKIERHDLAALPVPDPVRLVPGRVSRRPRAGRGDARCEYWGRELVLWRDDGGAFHLQDAFCPHLGAHLGVRRHGRRRRAAVPVPRLEVRRRRRVHEHPVQRAHEPQGAAAHLPGRSSATASCSRGTTPTTNRAAVGDPRDRGDRRSRVERLLLVVVRDQHDPAGDVGERCRSRALPVRARHRHRRRDGEVRHRRPVLGRCCRSSRTSRRAVSPKVASTSTTTGPDSRRCGSAASSTRSTSRPRRRSTRTDAGALQLHRAQVRRREADLDRRRRVRQGDQQAGARGPADLGAQDASCRRPRSPTPTARSSSSASGTASSTRNPTKSRPDLRK